MRLSLHVGEKGIVTYSPLCPLHPTQGSLPCGRLDSQPPLQLLLIFSSLPSLSFAVPGPAMIASVVANDVRVVVRAAIDGRRDGVVLTTGTVRCGLAACFGASIETGGSELAGPVGICDAAGAHSMTVDKTTTAEGARKRDDDLMTKSFRGRRCRPIARRYNTTPSGIFRN